MSHTFGFISLRLSSVRSITLAMIGALLCTGIASVRADQLGVTPVARSARGESSVSYGALHSPIVVSAQAGVTTPPIYGRIYQAGVTEAAGVSSQVIAQLGFGKVGTDPRSDESWTWTEATFNAQVEDNDEYQAAFTAPATPGQYAYTYRFALVQDGTTSAYAYVDLDGAGSNPGLSFDPARLGVLSVTETGRSEALVDYGVLQFPVAASAEPGALTPLIYGRAYKAGVTEAAGESSELVAQLGFGKPGTDPRNDASWTWTDASFNAQIGNNDEYQAALAAPDVPGQYAYTYRFALVQDGAVSAYTYVDVDGAGANPGLSFDPARLGVLSVSQTLLGVPPADDGTQADVPSTEPQLTGTAPNTDPRSTRLDERAEANPSTYGATAIADPSGSRLAPQVLTALCPGTLTVDDIRLWANSRGAPNSDGTWAWVPNNQGISRLAVRCTDSRSQSPANNAFVGIGADKPEGLNFVTQACPINMSIRGLITYTRNDVVDYIDVVCRDDGGNRFERPAEYRERILSAGWQGSVGQPVDGTPDRPLACRVDAKGVGVIYDGIVRQVWLICDQMNEDSVMVASPTPPLPSDASGVSKVAQPEPCAKLRPQPGTGVVPGVAIQTSDGCPEPANPAGVVAIPTPSEPAKTICETHPDACAYRPGAKAIKVRPNEPAPSEPPH